MNLKKYFLPKGWTEKKNSEDSYRLNIPSEQIDSWKAKKWKKDNVEKLMKIDGFHMKADGRSGTIYFVEDNKLCEIYFESSAVKEFDILIFFDELSHWELPIRKEMTEDKKKLNLEKLKIWLKEKKLKSDL
jgi:hypothetical protein